MAKLWLPRSIRKDPNVQKEFGKSELNQKPKVVLDLSDVDIPCWSCEMVYRYGSCTPETCPLLDEYLGVYES